MANVDWNSIGPDKAHKSGEAAADAALGTYKPNVDKAEVTSEALPKGPEPSPFSAGDKGGK